MKKLHDCISEHVDMSENSVKNVLSKFRSVQISKGDHFLRSGKICRDMAFIESGYLRMYDIHDGKEITLWIGGENRFITSLSSFIFETSNFWNIQAVTDCKLYVIKREDHFALNKKEPKWLEFDNILLANSFAILEQRMFAQLHTTAKQRYDHLMNENPELFKHVPLQYIASMLGITPESLSRLRKLK